MNEVIITTDENGIITKVVFIPSDANEFVMSKELIKEFIALKNAETYRNMALYR